MLRSLLLASTALLSACAAAPPPPALIAPAAAEIAPAPAPAIPARSAALAAFFDQYDQAGLALSPMAKAYRGINDGDYGKLDDNSDAAAIEDRALDQRAVETMQARFDRATLNPEDQLSYDVFLYRNARSASIFGFRGNGYVFDQMNGAQADIPSF